MRRHADSQCSDRLVETQPVERPRTPQHFRASCKSLTARADRPASAAVASDIRVTAGYLWRRLSPRSFTGRCNGLVYPAPEARRPVPSRCLKCALRCTGRALPAQRPRRVLPAWILRGPVAPSPRGSTCLRQHFTASLQATQQDCRTSWVTGNTAPVFPADTKVRVILKEPHPRGVNPAESHAARFRKLTLSGWPPALRARE